ncbi:MAG: SAM-dependent methyltransferase [Streptosporangiaceae bacterium]
MAADDPSGRGDPGPAGGGPASMTAGFDTSVAHPARIWDYFLGGKDNFAADRMAAQGVLEVMPTMAMVARAGRAFLAAAVHYLATSGGVSQFLDIGTGLPTANNTHEVAQQARIVYVDNDPIVLAHARALLTSGPDGKTAYVDDDIRDTGRILGEAARTLDFSQPVAVMLLAVLHFVPDADDPYKITSRLMEALPSGSFLALSHATSDIETGVVAAGAERYNQRSAVPVTLRTRAQVARFFDGLEVIDPGVVPLGHWHPGPLQQFDSPGLPTYCAVGRKP